ncbi:MAG: DUF4406 domain-containing protein [Thaumarchaeota archaeon]|nr:DUF4406 domain-containing protein [Nitrososphaerota archaeon]
MDNRFSTILLIILWSIIGCLVLYIIIMPAPPMQIYIAGKYSGTMEEIKYNVNMAEYWGMQVADKCNYPLVPHLLGYMSQENHTYYYWTNLDNIALKKSDAVFITSHSKGSDAELELAKKLGKPIYYSIDQVPNRCKQ